MKFQCSVCGQIINTNESCPICGSNKDKIISLGDDENSVTYRCLSCGRVFENSSCKSLSQCVSERLRSQIC